MASGRVARRRRPGRILANAAAEDARAWLGHYAPGRPGDWLTFRRIAVTEEQAREAGALDEHGKAEADALPVPVMDAILTGALDGLLDPAIRARVLGQQARERQRVVDAVAGFREQPGQ